MASFFEKIKLTIEAEKQKYRRKGAFNAVLSWVLLFVMIWGAREVAISYWPTDLQPQDRVNFVFKASLVIHFFSEIVFSMIYLPGYLGLSSFYDRHLINRETKRPWERQNWPDIISSTLKLIFFTSVIIYSSMLYLGMKFGSVRFRFDNFPGFWEIFWQIILLAYIEDLVQYITHRLFHDVKFLYKFHKVHHEHDAPFALTSEYGHPVDYVIGNMIPQNIMFMFISSHIHIYTFFFWTMFKTFATKQAHSGYEFHFSPTRIAPFIASSHYHDFHHSHNIGNYASTVYIWDTFLTEQPANKVYFERLNAQEQKEIKEREAAKKVK